MAAERRLIEFNAETFAKTDGMCIATLNYEKLFAALAVAAERLLSEFKRRMVPMCNGETSA